MILFLFLIAAILLFSHFFVFYFIYIAFWLVKYKILLLCLSLFLSMSFLVISIIIHYSDNFVTRFFYYFSASWLWLLSNLFFTFTFLALALIIFQLFHIPIDLKIWASIAIMLSLMLSTYAFYNAKNIVVKQQEVTIKNLPEVWKSKKVVFISDVHIWAIIWKNFLDNMIEKINSLDADIVLIGWDLFDGSDWRLDYVADTLDNIKSKNWVYFVTGNHEVYLWMDVVKQAIEKSKIIDLSNEFVDIDGLQIVWLDYVEPRFSTKGIDYELSQLVNFDKTKPSILMYHAPIYIKEFKDFWFNLQLSWHTHKWQIWPYNFITNLMYKWYDYGLHTEGNYNLYTSNWVWTWWPPMRIWNNPEIVLFHLK